MSDEVYLWIGLTLAWLIIFYLTWQNRKLRDENYKLEKCSIDFELWKEKIRQRL